MKIYEQIYVSVLIISATIFVTAGVNRIARKMYSKEQHHSGAINEKEVANEQRYCKKCRTV